MVDFRENCRSPTVYCCLWRFSAGYHRSRASPGQKKKPPERPASVFLFGTALSAPRLLPGSENCCDELMPQANLPRMIARCISRTYIRLDVTVGLGPVLQFTAFQFSNLRPVLLDASESLLFLDRK